MTDDTVRTVDVDALAAALEAGEVPVLLDVRTPFEFAAGHVPGARSAPLHRIEEAARGLDPEAEVWLVCKSGARSASAAKVLAARGLTVVNVAGGTAAWRRSGRAVDPPASPRRLLVPALASLTLGLAPFTPEPHVVGKLRWVLGGAHGMAGADWFDLALHGAPWVWLLATALGLLRARRAG